DYEAALEFHREMGVVSLENESMGVYFIEDPDGYWIEIAPYRN
ncbi:MAG: lactoylglutathione lyase, partial [Clostridiaceae bacterium]|nr:lactoylglutathione lyase [Clostridiaceae bacterium]